MAQTSPSSAKLGSLLLCLLSPALAAYRFDRSSPRLQPAADPPSNITRKEPLPPRYFHEYGSQRVKFRYGRYRAPASNDTTLNGMQEFSDAVPESWCSNCYVTVAQAGLEFTNGKTVNTDVGLWLHHLLMGDLSRNDTACPTFKDGLRFFASGNERTLVDLTLDGASRTGFPLFDSPVIGFVLQLMNERPVTQDVVFTMDVEYIPTLSPDFRPVDAVWLDVTGSCGESDVKVTSKQMELNSPPTQLDFGGKIIMAGGHIHDGGTRCTIRQNNETLCDFVPRYGPPPVSGGAPAAVRAQDDSNEPHISAMPVCSDVGRYEIGDNLTIHALYDMDLHIPMTRPNGTYDPVMGVGIVYIKRDELIKPLSTATTGSLSPTPA